MDIEEKIIVEPPRSLELTVLENGRINVAWYEPLTEVDYYIMYKNGVRVAAFPYVIRNFEFPFSNESTSSNLIQISWIQAKRSTTFSAVPNTSYLFEISSVRDGVESARIGKTIIYTKKMVFEKVLITPNPCEVQDDITVEVKVKEEFETTIT